MSYDTIYIWKICQSCHKFSLLQEDDWRELPPFGGLSKAVKQLSKKTCCQKCVCIMMKGGEIDVSINKLPVRQGTENGSEKRGSEDTELPGVRDELRPWDLY